MDVYNDMGINSILSILSINLKIVKCPKINYEMTWKPMCPYNACMYVIKSHYSPPKSYLCDIYTSMDMISWQYARVFHV